MYTTSLHIGQSNKGNYATVRSLRFVNAQAKVSTYKRYTDNLGQAKGKSSVVKYDILFNGRKLEIVATVGSEYVVKMPDRTYGRVDIKTEQYLGAY